MMGIKAILTSTFLIFYACGVMYLLLDVKWEKLSKTRRLWATVYFIAFIALNIVAQATLGYALYGKYYLVFTQFPVFVLFLILSKYKGIKLFFVLLTEVFFSAPVMTAISVIRSFIVPPLWMYLVGYLLMLVLIKRYFKAGFNYMLEFAENSVFVVFTAIPLLYYIYTYALTGYQLVDMLINKRYFILNIPLLLVLLSYILLVQIFKMVSEKVELKNSENLANAQLSAAIEQIEQLRIAERQSAIYRHDLRHHMNYLNACMTENKFTEAATYIQQTCTDVDNMTLQRYSENEPINLILSSYVGKANEKEIQIEVNVTATDFARFQITDLCSLLANGLENAIHGCEQLTDSKERFIRLRIYEKNSRLCLEICNSYTVEPVFEKKVPVSQRAGHGIGVKSMIYVVEKYEGVYGFSAKDGEFRFQVSM